MIKMNTQLLCLTVILVSGVVTQSEHQNLGESEAKSPPAHPSDPHLESKKLYEPPQPTNNTLKKVQTGETSKDKVKDSSKPSTQSVMPESHGDSSEVFSDNMYSATKRAAFLLSGISILVLIYFVWKSYRLKRRQTHVHKYGVIASREDLEMTSLGFGSEDDEDDTTHFDIGKHQRS